ncbi:DUF5625 family protein [Herbaspirillum sp. DW155]|uniref:DUF5625 family protein n=1 Tax=Herbaspirillum sp. DW155 TaxID=3095609 RepID=UPI003091FFF6|nr:DUF5625 family protein [Herbaspirillum sp. DW155]
MMVKKKLRKIMALVGLAFAAKALAMEGKDEQVSGKIHESRYHTPFPLQKGGEKIDVLVRVEETDRAYGLYLIFVLKQNWPEEKKEALYRLYQGYIAWREPHKPYPVKIRLLIDSVDLKNDVHIDRLVTERSLKFSRDADNGAETWYANALFMERLPAGVYRIRLENAVAVPEIDFMTLFAFEKDNRKY